MPVHFRKASPRHQTHPQNRQVFFWGGAASKTWRVIGKGGKTCETHPSAKWSFLRRCPLGQILGIIRDEEFPWITHLGLTRAYFTFWNICLKRCELHWKIMIHWGGEHVVIPATPRKIDMDNKHGGLVQMMFLFNWVMFRFHHINFQGCTFSLLSFQQTNLTERIHGEFLCVKT